MKALQEYAKMLDDAAAINAAEAVRHGEHGRTELQAGYHGIADGLRLAAKMLGQAMAERPRTYPLYCVDRQDRVSPEHQYRGPFATHDEAHEQAESGDLVRRCRRVRATEIDGWRFALGELMLSLDEQATSGEVPDGTWGDFKDEVAHAGDGLAAAIGAALDEHVRVDAYICEGDE